MLIVIKSSLPDLYEVSSDITSEMKADGLIELIKVIENLIGKTHQCDIDEDRLDNIIEDYIDEKRNDMVKDIKQKFLAKTPDKTAPTA